MSISPAIPKTSPGENAGTTPKNSGGATGPGDEFVYLPETGPGFEFPNNLAWDYAVSGGVMTTLVVALELSDDGQNWTAIDTASSLTTSRKVVANQVPRYMRLNITSFVGASGSPVVTGGITC